jgi:hypothetical protein
MRHQPSIINLSLFVQNKGEQSSKIALKLTTAKHKIVVRITGGCGDMSPSDAANLIELYKRAFAGFAGAMLFGGTRMVSRSNAEDVVPGITEVAPAIRRDNPDSVILGVIAKTDDLQLDLEKGLVVSQESDREFITIAHPDQDLCLVVQPSVDGSSPWEAEFQECMSITQNLRDFADWRSLLVCYNGGGVTEKELLATAERGWPILLIKGSGRITDRYASDQEFLFRYPNVAVAKKNFISIREKLIGTGAIESQQQTDSHSGSRLHVV